MNYVYEDELIYVFGYMDIINCDMQISRKYLFSIAVVISANSYQIYIFLLYLYITLYIECIPPMPCCMHCHIHICIHIIFYIV